MAEMLLAGDWKSNGDLTEVTSPYDGSTIDTVPLATSAEVDSALEYAHQHRSALAKIPGYERSKWLRKAAQLVRDQTDAFARTISREEGKTLAESKFEVSRAVETLDLSADEAKRLTGHSIPLHGAPGADQRLGFTVRVPCGVVLAISPFNFPLNLVAHKVGPALAAGNSIILKPASDTPLTALAFCKLLLEAGVPPSALQCLTGAGSKLGKQICSDKRVRKISFTGSYKVGKSICKAAGMKKVTMELGSASPLIVMDDANMEKVIDATVATGYSNAGQVCISTQRVLVDKNQYSDFIDLLAKKVEKIRTGNPLSTETDMGPMIRTSDADRVTAWISEAVDGGARLITGGEQSGSTVKPAILADVKKDMKVVCDELFGPAVAVAAFDNLDDAIEMANSTEYGLAAGIFTENIGRALRFIQDVHAGNLHINWGPGWRADLMPYGGLKHSGIGKEGPPFAIHEMSEEKMVVFHG